MGKIGRAILGAGAAISEFQDAKKSENMAKAGEKKLANQYSNDIPKKYYTEGRAKAMDEIKGNIKSGDNVSARKRVLQQLDRIEKQAIKDGAMSSAEYVKPNQKKYEKLLKGHGISSMKF